MDPGRVARIRPACPEDLIAVNAFNPFAGDREREIAEGRMLVAEEGGQVAGYLSWAPRGFVGRNFVTYLCVRPEHRRRGLAMALLRAIETHIAHERLFVSTEEDNAAMLSLLPREGWTHAGAVEGANDRDRAEVFFYKDLSPS